MSRAWECFKGVENARKIAGMVAGMLRSCLACSRSTSPQGQHGLEDQGMLIAEKHPVKAFALFVLDTNGGICRSDERSCNLTNLVDVYYAGVGDNSPSQSLSRFRSQHCFIKLNKCDRSIGMDDTRIRLKSFRPAERDTRCSEMNLLLCEGGSGADYRWGT